MWAVLIDFADPETIKNALATNEFAQGGAIAAVMATVGAFLWTNLKSVPVRIWNFISYHVSRWTSYIVTVQHHNELYDVMSDWIITKYPKQLRNVEGFYGLVKNTIRSADLKDNQYQRSYSDDEDTVNNKKIYFAQYSDRYWIWWKRRPLIIKKIREKIEGAKESSQSHKDVIKIKSLFGKKHVNSFISAAVDQYEGKNRKKFKAKYYVPEFRGWDSTSNVDYRATDSIVSRHKKELLEDIDKFLANEEWYTKRGIPYKRGILMTGPPGNGKSSLIRALAYYTKRNVYYLNLTSISGDMHLQKVVPYLGKDALLVIEDFDSFFDGRNPVSKKVDMTFSGLLNALDGIGNPHGLITIITTNKPETLDPALTRAGRMDKKIVLHNPNQEEAQQYVNMFYGEDTPIKYNKDISFAALQGLCIENDKETLIKLLED